MYDPRDFDQALGATGWAPLPGPPASFGEAFGAALAGVRAVDRSDSEESLLAEVAARHLEPWQKAGLARGNPLAWRGGFAGRLPTIQERSKAGPGRLVDPYEGLGEGERPAAWDALAAELEGKRELAPTLPTPPSYDELRAEARALAVERHETAAKAAARSLGMGAALGEALGGLVGAGGDPVNLGGMALGAMTGGTGSAAVSWARGLLSTVGREALAGAAATALVQPGVQSWRAELGLEHGLGPAVSNVYDAALFSGGLAGGLGLAGKGLGLGISGTLHGWQAAKGLLGRVAERGELRDAERALEATAGYVDARPGPGPGLGSAAAAEAAHMQALAHAEASVLGGQAPGGPAVDQAARLAGAGRPAGPDGAVAGSPRGPWTARGALFTPTGRRVAVRYELVELQSLLPSHLDDGALNPRYRQELQPRDRERAASQAQIAGMAADLQPERLGRSASSGEGAPIVGPDGMVESGNGRVLALRKARNDGLPGWRRYQEWLRAEGHDTSGMRAPVLIARRLEPMDSEQRALFAREANAPPNLTMGAAERAASDSRLVPDSVLDLWKGGEVDAAANRDFRRAVAGHLPETERGAMTGAAGGAVSQEGLRRLQGLLMAKAYEDGHLLTLVLEATDSDVRAIGGALMDVAGRWATLRRLVAGGQVPAEMDITRQLLEAVAVVRKARGEGLLVSEVLAQHGLFGDLDPVTELLVRLMYRDEELARAAGRGRVAERLSAYLEEAEKTTPGPGLFGDLEPVGPRSILGHVLGRAVEPGPVDLDAAAGVVRATEAALPALERAAEAPAAAIAAEAGRLATVKPGEPTAPAGGSVAAKKADTAEAPARQPVGQGEPVAAKKAETAEAPRDPLVAEAEAAAAEDPGLLIADSVELLPDGTQRTVYRSAAEVLAEAAEEARYAAELGACAVATYGKGVMG